jgi:hypothetical protein
LKHIVEEHEATAEAAAATEAIAAAAEQYAYKPPKTYTLPFIWAWGQPVFAATASALIALQCNTGIPWLPFIAMCGFGVRLMLAPLMFR